MKGSYLQQQADEAPEAGFAPVNYGRLSVTPNVVTFGTGDDKHASPTRAAMKDGQKLAKNQSLELHIEVNISELNPALGFEYTRDVRLQKSSARLLTDWSEIVLPSLIATFGENWGDAILKEPYVEVEDVPNVNGTISKNSGKVLGVPKFIKAFKSKAECVKAREARFGSAGGSSDSSSSGDDGDIPAKAINQTKELLKSVGDEATALTMLANHPFGPYDGEALIEAARR